VCPRTGDEEGDTTEDGKADAPCHAVHSLGLDVVRDDQAAECEHGQQQKKAPARTARRRA
jgi:hypothetical protein